MATAADATTYYLDCQGGDDTATGTSSDAPWRSLARAGTHTYAPGERLLLKRGTKCEGVLAPQGKGADGEPVRIDAYGDESESKPHIEGGGARAALLLIDTEQWEIRNLDLSNTGPVTTTDRRAGLYVELTDYGVAHHFVVEDVDVHDVNGADFKDPDPSGGILFAVKGSTTATRFDHLRVSGSTVRHVDRTGIATSSTWERKSGAEQMQSTGIEFTHNKVYDAGGDGIVVQKARGALVEGNYVDGFNMRSTGYNAGIWAWDSDDVLYQYNEVTGGHGTNDSMAYDIDGGNNRNVYRYNYSHDNEGGFLLVCNAKGMTSDGNRVHDNISVNDRNMATPYGVVSVVCRSATDTRVYRNTIVTKYSGTALVSGNGSTGVTFEDNVFVGATGQAGSPIRDTVNTYRNNLYWRTDQPRDAAGVRADPLLVSAEPAAPDDVRLKSGSPARGTGSVKAGGDGTTHDYFGNPIPDPPNIGADQSR
ncbi:right-handed parallel beta-helix repeat-containing protein [Embleya scabrispora]|uniref:right-handed parallel beta-helix repeat-containing protein n=1 Tax=Embleya scabrispora TaxID=159449 RepID=UPI001374A95A|nr:right-handed parallel beta-helix repeat-containing protein [Embleya scabrispora]